MVQNILSIDLESWIHFYIDALRSTKAYTGAQRKALDGGYIREVTEKILDLLDRYHQHATFFVVGELFDWYPEMIQMIRDRGHEVGYHTHSHRILYDRTILESELRLSAPFLNEFKPRGFRAPQIFITRDSLSCLPTYGFTYSSSTYNYGSSTVIDGINEIPVTTLLFRKTGGDQDRLPRNLNLKMLARELPVGSGLFLSLLGSGSSYFINKINKTGRPVVLFVHPWQLYSHHGIINPAFLAQVLYRNPLCAPYLRNVLPAFGTLLQRHHFVSFQDYYGQ